MKIYYPEIHKNHNPPYEGYTSEGNLPALEVPERADQVLRVLSMMKWASISLPCEFDLETILAIHSQPYLTYLQNAYAEWEKYSPVKGMAFIPGTYGINHESVAAGSVLEKAGFFLMDTTVGITTGTFPAALQSAFAALSGAQEIAKNRTVAFALCRPPGHHAGHEICGGYCFLNNAAIATHWLSLRGKVAILDIDYHAGNGTQEIFYNRADIFVTSIHADPKREYPRYAGGDEEKGIGPGTGFHKNFPLSSGITDSDYLITLDQALDLIAAFSPRYLVVSAGMDIYQEDPLGDFKITRQGIHEIGKHIAGLRLPTLIVMEGGYHLPTLGENFAELLKPFTN